MNILVVDDDASQRLYIKLQLERLGHQVCSVDRGDVVIKAIEENAISVAICDLEMPEMDGLTLVRLIRAHNWGRYIYVLMLTGRDQIQDYVAGLDAGADDFMSKPVNMAALTVRLNAARRLLDYDRELTARNYRLAKARDRIEEDLKAAEQAQRAILPDSEQRIGPILARSVFLPSSYVAGDIFNYFPLENGAIGFYAADVSGHGVRAALLAVALGYVLTPAMFNVLTRDEGEGWRPDQLVDELNRRFGLISETAGYFTIVCGIIDPQIQTLALCQAGHPPLLRLSRSGVTEMISYSGLPVAVFSDATYETMQLAFEPGDRLLVFSDGVSEAVDSNGEAFGEERIMSVLSEAHMLPSDEILPRLMDQIEAWVGRAGPKADDISAICFEFEEEADDHVD